MKKFNKIAIAFTVIIIGLLVFVIFKSLANENSSDIRDKAITELKYFESKIISMFNSLNNIEYENYQISIEDISEKSKKSSQKSDNSANSGDSSDNSQQSNSSTESGEESESSEGAEQNNSKKYSLNVKGILTNNGEIKWDEIKNNAEILEKSISAMTLDLYEISLNNNEILSFNNDFDVLLIQIKNEDKQKTLEALATIYSYIPKFVKYCDKDEQYEILLKTKQQVLNAYSILELNDWNQVAKYVQEAIDVYSKLLTNINIENKNQYVINKCYITLNNLKNAVEHQEIELFLIKYKNLLEELNTL